MASIPLKFIRLFVFFFVNFCMTTSVPLDCTILIELCSLFCYAIFAMLFNVNMSK